MFVLSIFYEKSLETYLMILVYKNERTINTIA